MKTSTTKTMPVVVSGFRSGSAMLCASLERRCLALVNFDRQRRGLGRRGLRRRGATRRVSGGFGRLLDGFVEFLQHRRETPDRTGADGSHLFLDGRLIARQVGREARHLDADDARERDDDAECEQDRDDHRRHTPEMPAPHPVDERREDKSEKDRQHDGQEDVLSDIKRRQAPRCQRSASSDRRLRERPVAGFPSLRARVGGAARMGSSRSNGEDLAGCTSTPIWPNDPWP